MRIALLLLAIASTIPTTVRSQEAAVRTWPLAVGSRVRVTSPVFGTKVGTAASVSADTLIFRAGNDTAHQPVVLSQIAHLEVMAGTHTTKAKDSGIGFLLGAAAGGILGAASYQKPTCDPNTFCIDFFGPSSRDASALAGGVLGALVGAAVGAIAGMRSSDTWAPIVLPYSMRQ
jgi:hypothetical protein